MMKKLFFLIMFVPLLAFGQTIKGIGKLSLDMSLKEVQSLFPNKLVKQKTSSEVKKIYKLSSYTPIREHTFKNLYLYFYNDTLYTIYALDVPAKLKDSFTIKYGAPTENIYRFRSYTEEMIAIFKNDASDFIFSKNNGSSHGFQDTFYKWKNGNPFVEVLYVFGTYFVGDDIKAREVFYIKNLAYAKCIELEEEKIKEQEKENRAMDLEGL